MSFIGETQSLLGAVIKKPPLTEKLLSRPPFRFLHDIFSAVTAATGFGKGLFEGPELDAKSMDKNAKVAWLNKAIGVVSVATQKSCPAKPAKIVSGLEAEKTNVYLQMLAEAATNPVVSNDEAVASVLSGNFAVGEQKKPSEPKPKPSEPKPKPQESQPEPVPEKKPSEGSNNKKKEDDQPADLPPKPSGEKRERKKRPPPRESPQASPQEEKPKRPERPDKPAKRERPAAPSGQRRPPRPEESDDTNMNNNNNINDNNSNNNDNDASSRRVPPAKPAKPAKQERPMTARGAPPKVRSNVRTIEKTDAVAPIEVSGEPRMSGLILDDDGMDDDDDDGIVIVDENDPTVGAGIALGDGLKIGGGGSSGIDGGNDDDAALEGQQHGALVNELMQLKKESDAKMAEHERAAGRGKRNEQEIVFGGQNQRVQDRKAVEAEIAKLREGLQKLTQSINPIGKSMDFVHEDLESMQRELAHWRDINRTSTKTLEEQKENSESSLTPLHNELAELEQKIRDQNAKIRIIKAKVITNDETITRLLKMVVTSNN